MASPTIQQALQQARHALNMHDSARLDAEVLLAHLLDKPRSHLLAWPDKILAQDQAHAFDKLILRRARGEPVAHLTGEREFWSMNLEVSADTLIPRPDTETLVEQVLQRLPADRRLQLADLGTGSGAVALALATERPGWTLYAVDRSEDCITIARRNARRLSPGNVHCSVGDWFSAFAPSSLDALVSNPPYVADNDPHLQQGDVRFEPLSALTAGTDGLDAIRRLAGTAASVLRSHGHLFLEHAPEQAEEVHNILNKNNFTGIQVGKDLAGRVRISSARLVG